jgi:hypothetical protein
VLFCTVLHSKLGKDDASVTHHPICDATSCEGTEDCSQQNPRLHWQTRCNHQIVLKEMADSVLNAWERLNVGRAWNLCKASLHRGGDITALGLFMSSLVILKDSFTQDGRNRNKPWSTECAGHKIKEVVAHQYVNAAAAVLLMSTDSAESAMSTASVRHRFLRLNQYKLVLLQ